MERNLINTARLYNVKTGEPLLKGRFKELIFNLFHKTEIPVVILVDEYDKPIIDHLGKGKEAMETARETKSLSWNSSAIIARKPA